jgi:hypothetical protein
LRKFTVLSVSSEALSPPAATASESAAVRSLLLGQLVSSSFS